MSQPRTTWKIPYTVEIMNDIKIQPFLQEVVNRGASDLHIQVGIEPYLRQQGELVPLGQVKMTDDDLEALVFSILPEDKREVLFRNKEVDMGFSFGQNIGRFRVNVFYEQGSLAMSLRLIPDVIAPLEQLGLPPVVATFADFSQGLVLFSGPTGSGKSSSMAALIDKINRERKEHIITIEDPIEFRHRSKRSLIAQRELHQDTFSFAAALRSCLRQDPDIVLVGELRDLETIAAAMTIAETGHLVFATLHTNSAAQTINRLIDVFPPHQQSQIRVQLSTTLKAICGQQLVPKIDGGRAVATEVLIMNAAVRNLIRESKIHQIHSVIQNSVAIGMQSMDQTLAKFVAEGVVSYDQAYQFAHNITDFEQLAGSYNKTQI